MRMVIMTGTSSGSAIELQLRLQQDRPAPICLTAVTGGCFSRPGLPVCSRSPQVAVRDNIPLALPLFRMKVCVQKSAHPVLG